VGPLNVAHAPSRLINGHMWRNILVQSAYQLAVQLGLLWFGVLFLTDCTDGYGTYVCQRSRVCGRMYYVYGCMRVSGCYMRARTRICVEAHMRSAVIPKCLHSCRHEQGLCAAASQWTGQESRWQLSRYGPVLCMRHACVYQCACTNTH